MRFDALQNIIVGKRNYGDVGIFHGFKEKNTEPERKQQGNIRIKKEK